MIAHPHIGCCSCRPLGRPKRHIDPWPNLPLKSSSMPKKQKNVTIIRYNRLTGLTFTDITFFVFYDSECYNAIKSLIFEEGDRHVNS